MTKYTWKTSKRMKRDPSSSTSLVKAKIEKLTQTWQRSRRRKRGRYGFYLYLEAVYDFFAKLRETQGEATKVRNIVFKLRKSINSNTHAFYVFISASSSEDKRMQNRWSQALRYAWKWREKRKHLKLAEFFELNGGIAGCASKFANKVSPRVK